MKDSRNRSFTKLDVWKKARELKLKTEALAMKFPIEENYRLADQLIRSVRSVGAAIAEGHGRFTYKDQAHFCIIARGSLSETHHHIIDALDCRYITPNEYEEISFIIVETGKYLNGYISFLRKQIE